MDKERIQLLCDLLLVGKVEGSLEGNPDRISMKRRVVTAG
jgi:hypothetical protein